MPPDVAIGLFNSLAKRVANPASTSATIKIHCVHNMARLVTTP